MKVTALFQREALLAGTVGAPPRSPGEHKLAAGFLMTTQCPDGLAPGSVLHLKKTEKLLYFILSEKCAVEKPSLETRPGINAIGDLTSERIHPSLLSQKGKLRPREDRGPVPGHTELATAKTRTWGSC